MWNKGEYGGAGGEGKGEDKTDGRREGAQIT